MSKKKFHNKIKNKDKGCTGCEKGLVWVAKKVVQGKEKELKKLKLCPICRAIMIRTVEETFNKR